MQTQKCAVIALTPAADYSASKGYLVVVASDTATINASATVIPKGVILEGNETTAGYATEKVSVGILGSGLGAVQMRAGGAITKGDFVANHSDGTVVTDPATGQRNVVGVALETGVAGENISVAPITPRYFAS
jgi:hypothetical protein